MRRFVPILIAGAAFIAMACSDSIAPTTSGLQQAVAIDAAAANARNAQVGPNATIVSVTIPATGGVIEAGPYFVEFPANAVCVADAGYGPQFWDQDCETRTDDVTFDAAYWEENGEVYVEFIVDLRFHPGAPVILHAYSAQARKGKAGAKDIMFWSRSEKGKVRRNEAKSDKSLRTTFDPETGLLSRRVKHFSGYVIVAGNKCNDPNGCDGGM